MIRFALLYYIKSISYKAWSGEYKKRIPPPPDLWSFTMKIDFHHRGWKEISWKFLITHPCSRAEDTKWKPQNQKNSEPHRALIYSKVRKDYILIQMDMTISPYKNEVAGKPATKRAAAHLSRTCWLIWLYWERGVAPRVGLEPTTGRLTVACSTNWAIAEQRAASLSNRLFVSNGEIHLWLKKIGGTKVPPRHWVMVGVSNRRH